jgi:hypothetical protein
VYGEFCGLLSEIVLAGYWVVLLLYSAFLVILFGEVGHLLSD